MFKHDILVPPGNILFSYINLRIGFIKTYSSQNPGLRLENNSTNKNLSKTFQLSKRPILSYFIRDKDVTFKVVSISMLQQAYLISEKEIDFPSIYISEVTYIFKLSHFEIIIIYSKVRDIFQPFISSQQRFPPSVHDDVFV